MESSFLETSEVVKLKRKKGQSVIEFAIVLPFFMFCVVLVAYTCIFFSQYFMVKNTVYDCTREAAIKGHYTVQGNKTYDNFDTLASTYGEIIQQQTADSLYTTPYYPSIDENDNGTIVTTCYLYLNDTVPSWLHDILPSSLDISVQMHAFQ